MEEIKQVIVVRKDLNMRKGKMCAQVAHASMKIILDQMERTTRQYVTLDSVDVFYQEWRILIKQDSPLDKWLADKFTKIVVSVDSEEELMSLYVKAQSAGLPNALIQDAGKTEFKEPTYTCIAIGPDEAEKIDELTGELPLI